MPDHIKLVSERNGDDTHVRTRVFVGTQPGSLALAGELIMDVGEWQHFGAALLLGAQRMHGRYVVETEGDEAVVGAEGSDVP